MKKVHKAILHISLWLFVFVPFGGAPIILFNQNKEYIEQMMPSFNYDLEVIIWQMSIGLVEFLIVFYVFYFVILNLLKKTQQGWKNICLSFFVFALLVMQRWFWGFLPALNTEELSFVERLTTISVNQSSISIAVVLIQGGLALVFKTVISYFDERRKRKELETINLKSELSMLRSQVNPHFLFNTLNNIDSLINNNPKEASELLIKLSDEMRYMLYDSNTEKIEIASELNFLNNYISLQKIRINHKDPILVSTELDNQKELIPPMLFLPLVENSFKHGRFNSNDDRIQLTLKLKDHNLFFKISNPHDPDLNSVDSHKGLGLNLVKRRFDLIFPNTHKFEIRKDKYIFEVEFSIDLNEAYMYHN